MRAEMVSVTVEMITLKDDIRKCQGDIRDGENTIRKDCLSDSIIVLVFLIDGFSLSSLFETHSFVRNAPLIPRTSSSIIARATYSVGRFDDLLVVATHLFAV